MMSRREYEKGEGKQVRRSSAVAWLAWYDKYDR